MSSDLALNEEFLKSAFKGKINLQEIRKSILMQSRYSLPYLMKAMTSMEMVKSQSRSSRELWQDKVIMNKI